MGIGRRAARAVLVRAGGLVVAIAVVASAGRARAFDLDGHEVIEAVAYKRLLAMDIVPGTGVPGVPGRAGVALEVGRVDLVVDSPPLSYVSTARWHALPITVRLGLRLD